MSDYRVEMRSVGDGKVTRYLEFTRVREFSMDCALTKDEFMAMMGGLSKYYGEPVSVTVTNIDEDTKSFMVGPDAKEQP